MISISHSQSSFSKHSFKAGKSGFTLVEMLVVIAIIAILAALILPFGTMISRRSVESKCMSNLRQVAIGLNLYANENNNRYPQAYGDHAGNPQWSTWIWKMTPYLPNTKEGRGDAKDVLSCPAKPAKAAAGTVTYGINSYMLVGYNGWSPANANWSYLRSRVPNPSKTILVGEMELRNTDTLATSDKRNFLGNQNYGPGFRHGGKKATTAEGYSKANMAFCDGHVEGLTFDQLLLNPPDLASNPVETRSRWKWW